MTATQPAMHRLIGGTDDGPLCSLTDLPQAWCGHCRETKIQARQRIRRSRPTGNEVAHRFFCRYGGKCSRCGEDYQAQDYIGVSLNGDYVCEECC